MGTQSTALLAALLLTLPLAAGGDEAPARNPDYVHALPDLRTARWLLTPQPGDPPLRTNEDQAIQDINLAIRAVIKSGLYDSTDVSEHEQMQMAQDHTTRMHQALDLLHRAHAYLSKEAPDPMGTLVRNQVLEDIDRAGRAVGLALEAR